MLPVRAYPFYSKSLVKYMQVIFPITYFPKILFLLGGFLGVPLSSFNSNDALILAKIPHNHRYPYCVYTLVTSSTVYTYCGIFQEFSSAKNQSATTVSELYNSYYQSTGIENISSVQSYV